MPKKNQGSQQSAGDVARSMHTPLATDAATGFVRDAPIISKSQDRLGRRYFAERLAGAITSRRDASSLVIGLYGPWGEGKTSVLHLLEGDLAGASHSVVARFNPWRFNDEARLLGEFFDTVARALGRSLSTTRDSIAKWLRDYGALAAGISVGLPGTIQLNVGETLRTAGARMASPDMEELRVRIERWLSKEGIRVVVLIDDIDRLDRSEIQAIFKLVKLTADFPYTTYVVAFDEEIVAASLGERYAGGDAQAGRDFLEKIVQVPLHLPVADRLELRNLCFEGVDDALRAAGIELTEKQARDFARHFIDGLDSQLGNPRDAKRYANALQFALPILRGEVNPVDLMLVEGIRVFHPQLYDAIRRNGDLFLGSAFGAPWKADVARRRADSILAEAAVGMTADADDAMRKLLDHLFPRFKKTEYSSSSWDKAWEDGQHIASERYFPRYFGYSIGSRGVSDVEVESLLEGISASSRTDVESRLRLLCDGGRASGLVHALRRRAARLTGAAAYELAITFSALGALLPEHDGEMFFSSFSQGALLVIDLLRRIEDESAREVAARQCLTAADPIYFSVECLRWMKVDRRDASEVPLFSEGRERDLTAVVVARIAAFAGTNNLLEAFGREGAKLLDVWMASDRDSAVAHLKESLAARPASIGYVLQWNSTHNLSENTFELTQSGFDHLLSQIGLAEILDAIAVSSANGDPLAKAFDNQFSQFSVFAALRNDDAAD